MQTHHLYLLFSLLLITVSATTAATGELPPEPLVGGYKLIQNTSDPHVIEVAKLAVKQQNKQDPTHKLRLLSIIKGYSQVVAGTNWKLYLTAKPIHTHRRNRYLAVVHERPWDHFLNLTSFRLLV